MTLTVWGGFLAVILLLLGLDLFVLNRKAHIISAKEALLTTAMWVCISLCFNVAVYFLYEHHVFGLGVYPAQAAGAVTSVTESHLPQSGWDAALMFFTGYLVEQMLSMDNMLVIAMILGYFRVPAKLQHRVLFWGIIGAVVLRGAMILIGSELVHRWGKYVIPAFGVILLYSAFKMLVMREDEADMERSLIVRSARRVFNVSPQYDGDKFFTRAVPGGGLFITPLMLSLLVVDVADVIFAVDSIPAIFGITHDSFLVFSSNCFAILGLRAIYFAIAALIRRFRYIKVSMVFILGYIGIKMIADRWFHVAPAMSLLTIGGMLAVGLAASIVFPGGIPQPQDRPIDDLTRAAERGWKRARRVVILIVGLTVVFIMAPLIGALPGPGGIFVAIGGLALLATEFLWARKLLTKMRDKAQMLSGGSASSPPPKLWKIAVGVAGYAAFVGLLYWAEETWGHKFPKLEKNWYFLAIGPGIAVGYWVVMSLRRWFQLRRAPKTQAGPVASPPENLPAKDGTNQQRQPTGSAH